METCGFIMSRGKDLESFLMRCSHCETDLEIDQWQEFVLHFRNTHGFSNKDNASELERAEVDDDLSCIKEELLEIPLDEDGVKTELMVLSEAELSRASSSLSDTSLSENESTETESNDQSETEENQESPSNSDEIKKSKFNPTFYRRNHRTLQFVESYKNHPCLWNPENSNYKDPTACKAAYSQLISELETKIGVLFAEHSLKMAIKKLHVHYNTVGLLVGNGSLKPNSIAFNRYTSFSFLKASTDETNSDKNNKIQLNFSKRNKLTTDFIKLYAKFPQLYDNKHKDFSKMIARKEAYDQMAAETIVNNGDISNDDIYLAIQSLRQWYYRRTRIAVEGVTESEKFYLKACDFLPPKMFQQRLNCEICQQKASSDYVLQTHLYKVHNIGDLPFKCSLCDRSFEGRAGLTMHMQRAHTGKTHKCNYCDRAFAVIADLRLHIRTHTGNKILCELCGKAFRLKNQLKQHVTTVHTNVRAFKCTMCPKDFVKRVHLRDHMKSHLNIRDKICSTCGKGFTSCHSLIRHRQIHSEIKKFACKLCDARFSQFVGLNSHMKRTHNIVRNIVQKPTENIVEEQSIS